jgi:hypothetical protein
VTRDLVIGRSVIKILVRLEWPPKDEGLNDYGTLNNAHVTAHANFTASLNGMLSGSKHTGALLRHAREHVQSRLPDDWSKMLGTQQDLCQAAIACGPADLNLSRAMLQYASLLVTPHTSIR